MKDKYTIQAQPYTFSLLTPDQSSSIMYHFTQLSGMNFEDNKPVTCKSTPTESDVGGQFDDSHDS